MVYSPQDLRQVNQNTSTTSNTDKIVYAAVTVAVVALPIAQAILR